MVCLLVCDDQMPKGAWGTPEGGRVLQERVGAAHDARVDRRELERVRPALQVLVVPHAKLVGLGCVRLAFGLLLVRRVQTKGIIAELDLLIR